MSKTQVLGFSGALVLAALVGGTLISAVAAAPGAPRTGTPAAAAAAAPTADPASAKACATFRAALAKELGVSQAKLTEATRQAVLATIDAAVTDGTLTTTAADRLKARLASSTVDGCERLAKRLGRVRPALGVVRDGIEAAAGALHMPPADLRAQLRDGASLKTIATTKGVEYATVSAAVLDAVKQDLDQAVKAGTIKQAREDRVLARLTALLADGRLRKAP